MEQDKFNKYKNIGYISEPLRPHPNNIPVRFLNLSDMAYNVNFKINIESFADSNDDGTTSGNIDKLPDECPFCHNKITPIVIGNNVSNHDHATLILLCPTESCNEAFLAYYTGHYSMLYLQATSIGLPIKKKFHESIESISPNFSEIYNQAFWAEQFNLNQICGVGYRKSLEFLIKDFAKLKNPSAGDINFIETKLLGEVIKKYMKDEKIKLVSERAAWLGNDETHYIRKWEDKDVTDLKLVIDLALIFIQADYDFDKLMKSMPGPVK